MHLVQEYGADETALLEDSIGRRVWQPPSWLLSGTAPILLEGLPLLDTLPRCSALS